MAQIRLLLPAILIDGTYKKETIKCRSDQSFAITSPPSDYFSTVYIPSNGLRAWGMEWFWQALFSDVGPIALTLPHRRHFTASA